MSRVSRCRVIKKKKLYTIPRGEKQKIKIESNLQMKATKSI